MYERAEFAKEIGSVIFMIDLTIGYTAMTSMAKWARRNGVILHLHRAGHGTYTRQKTHGVSFRVIAKWCACWASTTSTRAPWSASSRAIRTWCRGFYDTLRKDFIERDPAHGIYFDQDWASMPGVMPVASGGIHAGQMHQLLHYLGEDVVLQFGGGTIGHPMGIAAGATANRVAVELMIQARNEGRDYFSEGPGDPRAAGRWCAPLRAALEVWKDISFNYESTDTPDVVADANARSEEAVDDAPHPRNVLVSSRRSPTTQIRAQMQYALDNDWALSVEFTDDPHPRNFLLGDVGPAHVRPADPAAIMLEVQRCREAYPTHYIRVNAYDRRLGRQTTALSFIVKRPRTRRASASSAGGRRPPVRYTLHAYATDRHRESGTSTDAMAQDTHVPFGMRHPAGIGRNARGGGRSLTPDGRRGRPSASP